MGTEKNPVVGSGHKRRLAKHSSRTDERAEKRAARHRKKKRRESRSVLDDSQNASAGGKSRRKSSSRSKFDNKPARRRKPRAAKDVGDESQGGLFADNVGEGVSSSDEESDEGMLGSGDDSPDSDAMSDGDIDAAASAAGGSSRRKKSRKRHKKRRRSKTSRRRSSAFKSSSTRKKKKSTKKKKRTTKKAPAAKTSSHALKTGRHALRLAGSRVKRAPKSRGERRTNPIVEQEDPTSLFAQFRNFDGGISAVVNEIVGKYVSDDETDEEEVSEKQSEVIARLVELVIHSCGCSSVRFTAEDLAEGQIAPHLQRFIDAHPPTADYPLISTDPALRNVIPNVDEFFRLLFEELGEAVHDGKLLPTLSSWLSALSYSSQRPFRHTSCLLLFRFMEHWIQLRRQIKKRHKHIRKKLARQRAALEKARKNKKPELSMRQKALQAELKDLMAHLETITETLNEHYQSVFSHRYRDTVPEIRGLCLQSLCEWVVTYRHMFLDDQHVRYFGWQLYDRDPSVRRLVLQLLHGLYDSASTHMRGQLSNFTRKFLPRIAEMTMDIAPAVACEAARLLRLLFEERISSSHPKEDEIVTEALRLVCTEKVDLEDVARTRVMEELGRFVWSAILRSERELHGKKARVTVKTIVEFVKENIVRTEVPEEEEEEGEDVRAETVPDSVGLREKVERFLRRIFKAGKRSFTKWSQYDVLLRQTTARQGGSDSDEDSDVEMQPLAGGSLVLPVLLQVVLEETAMDKQLGELLLPVLPQWLKQHETDPEWVVPLLDVLISMLRGSKKPGKRRGGRQKKKQLTVLQPLVVEDSLRHHLVELKKLVKSIIWKHNTRNIFSRCAKVLGGSPPPADGEMVVDGVDEPVAGVWEDICQSVEDQFAEDFVDRQAAAAAGDDDDALMDSADGIRDLTDLKIRLSRMHEWMIVVRKTILPDSSEILKHFFFILRRQDVPAEIMVAIMDIVAAHLVRVVAPDPVLGATAADPDATLAEAPTTSPVRALSRFVASLIRIIDRPPTDIGGVAATAAMSQALPIDVQATAYHHLCDTLVLYPSMVTLLEEDIDIITAYFSQSIQKIIKMRRKQLKRRMRDRDEDGDAAMESDTLYSRERTIARRPLAYLKAIRQGALPLSAGASVLYELSRATSPPDSVVRANFKRSMVCLRQNCGAEGRMDEIEFGVIKRLFSRVVLAADATARSAAQDALVDVGNRLGRIYSMPIRDAGREETRQDHLLKLFDRVLKYVHEDIRGRGGMLAAFMNTYLRRIDGPTCRQIVRWIDEGAEEHMSQDDDEDSLAGEDATSGKMHLEEFVVAVKGRLKAVEKARNELEKITEKESGSDDEDELPEIGEKRERPDDEKEDEDEDNEDEGKMAVTGGPGEEEDGDLEPPRKRQKLE